MTARTVLADVRDSVTYIAGAAFFITLAAWNAGREQYHNYRRWPGL